MGLQELLNDVFPKQMLVIYEVEINKQIVMGTAILSYQHCVYDGYRHELVDNIQRNESLLVDELDRLRMMMIVGTGETGERKNTYHPLVSMLEGEKIKIWYSFVWEEHEKEEVISDISTAYAMSKAGVTC